MRTESFFLAEPFGAYCEHLIPERQTHEYPIIMIHGVAHTGECYRRKPDGSTGWADYFVERGFEVFVVDWPGTGRSHPVPFDRISGEFLVEAFAALLTRIGKKVILFTHSMSGPYGWKLAELQGDRIAQIVAVAPGEPGNIQSAPKITMRNAVDVEIEMSWGTLKINLGQYLQNDEAFVQKKLIGTSALFPRAHLKAYVTSLKPRHPQLTFERLNIDESQLKVTNFGRLNGVKILVVTGTNDADHPREVDARIVRFFKQHKISCEHLWLGDHGIVGNGHMLMLEQNSDQIAALILEKLAGS